MCALAVSLATDILTCCSAAAGSWRAARKYPACTQSHIQFFASTITPASRNSHLTFVPHVGGFLRPAERQSED